MMKAPFILVFYISIQIYSVRSFQSALIRPTNRVITQLGLNRFLFGPDELVNPIESAPKSTVILPKDDYRTVHAAKILGLQDGDTIRAGVVDHELTTDNATIRWIVAPTTNTDEEPSSSSRNGSKSDCLEITLHDLTAPSSDSALCVSIILALPRPLALGRILPMISQLGVERIVLTGASKVPKDYFGSHLFQHSHEMRERLLEGLCQAGDVRMPDLVTCKNLRRFLRDDLDRLFPVEEYARIVAHPQRINHEPMRMKDVVFPRHGVQKRIVLAVGPEGGWEEPEELERFDRLGFQQITLGNRALRTDVAVVSLVSLANEICKD